MASPSWNDFWRKATETVGLPHFMDEYRLGSGSYITANSQSPNLIKLAKEDIMPEVYERYGVTAKLLGLSSVPPVYLDKDDDSNTPQVQFVTTHSGMNAIIINAKSHRWSAEFAQRTMMTSEEHIQNQIKSGWLINITQAESEGKLQVSLPTLNIKSDDYQILSDLGIISTENKAEISPDVIKKYKQMAHNMNLPYVPDLYVGNSLALQIELRGSAAAAIMTKEGRMMILATPSFLHLPPNQQEGLLGHELTHLEKGDASAQGVADTHNYPTSQIAKEHRADVNGTGPEGTCDPTALAKVFEQIYAKEKTVFFDYNPNATDVEFKAFLAKNDPEHPTLLDRIAYLEDAAAHPPEGCLVSPASTPTHKATTKPTITH